MSWIGGVIGGTIGMFVGGPVGAAAGAAMGAGLGAVLDEFDGSDQSGAESQTQQVNIELQSSADYEGVHLVGRVMQPLPQEATIRTQVISHEQRLGGHSPFINGDGTFCVVSDIVDNEFRIYIPFAAIVNPYGAHTALLELDVFGVEGETPYHIGEALFHQVLPLTVPWSIVRFIAPLIRLCMTVAYADGSLDRTEVRAVKEVFMNEFELAGEELEMLKAVMKQGGSPDLALDLQSVTQRLPRCGAEDILRLLAIVAHADDVIHLAEIEVISEICRLMGADEHDLPEILNAFQLEAIDHHAVLGVSKDASPREIKAKYREMMRSYHPDRVAQLPIEFQEVAHKKTIEIKNAYEALMK